MGKIYIFMVFTNYVCVTTSHIFCFFFSLLLTLQKLQCRLFDSHDSNTRLIGCTVWRLWFRWRWGDEVVMGVCFFILFSWKHLQMKFCY